MTAALPPLALLCAPPIVSSLTEAVISGVTAFGATGSMVGYGLNAGLVATTAAAVTVAVALTVGVGSGASLIGAVTLSFGALTRDHNDHSPIPAEIADNPIPIVPNNPPR